MDELLNSLNSLNISQDNKNLINNNINELIILNENYFKTINELNDENQKLRENINILNDHISDLERDITMKESRIEYLEYLINN